MNRGPASEKADSTGLCQALRWARVLEALDDEAVAELATLGEQRAFEAHEAIFREYESADSLFIVLEGQSSPCCANKGMQRELVPSRRGHPLRRTSP